MTIDNDFDAVCGVGEVLSVAVAVKLKVPDGAVGVPVIVPSVFKVNPLGNAPAETLHE